MLTKRKSKVPSMLLVEDVLRRVAPVDSWANLLFKAKLFITQALHCRNKLLTAMNITFKHI